MAFSLRPCASGGRIPPRHVDQTEARSARLKIIAWVGRLGVKGPKAGRPTRKRPRDVLVDETTPAFHVSSGPTIGDCQVELTEILTCEGPEGCSR